VDELLSKEGTKKGRLQRACLTLLREHEADEALPTSVRFLFYELLDRDVIPKDYRNSDGTRKPRTPGQDISDAVMHLREAGLVPWDWITDETRSLDQWTYAGSVRGYAADAVEYARIDPWDGEPPPLILCESRSLAGALRDIAYHYLCPIAATNGQAGGFLHASVAPLIEDAGEQRVLYLGDYDLSGGHIEENAYKVLSEYAALAWERVAITRGQIDARSLPVVEKPDRRYKPVRYFEAVETEALGQAEIARLLTERLDRELPEPLEAVLRREERQRVQKYASGWRAKGSRRRRIYSRPIWHRGGEHVGNDHYRKLGATGLLTQAFLAAIVGIGA
jgi:hypothetical protein